MLPLLHSHRKRGLWVRLAGVGGCWIRWLEIDVICECLLTARLLCRMAVAMDSLSASERLDFSQCVTKIDRNIVGPILFWVCRSKIVSM